MVVDAVLYHPTIAHYLRFVATTGNAFPLALYVLLLQSIY